MRTGDPFVGRSVHCTERQSSPLSDTKGFLVSATRAAGSRGERSGSSARSTAASRRSSGRRFQTRPGCGAVGLSDRFGTSVFRTAAGRRSSRALRYVGLPDRCGTSVFESAGAESRVAVVASVERGRRDARHLQPALRRQVGPPDGLARLSSSAMADTLSLARLSGAGSLMRGCPHPLPDGDCIAVTEGPEPAVPDTPFSSPTSAHAAFGAAASERRSIASGPAPGARCPPRGAFLPASRTSSDPFWDNLVARASGRQSSAMPSPPRRPSRTMRIVSSAERRLRVRRGMS